MTIGKICHPEAQHQAFRQDAITLLNKYAGELTGQEMLALGAHLVGQLIAFQDQRSITPAMAMEIVQRNIEIGNREAMVNMLKTDGSA